MKASGARNAAWKGGRVVASNGYILIRVGKDHHLADVRGYAYEHRLVAEKKLGRPLAEGEVVHHVDGIKSNNDSANIEVLPSTAHHSHHHGMRQDRRHPDTPNEEIACACGCGATMARWDSLGRPRRFISGHNGRRSAAPKAVR